MLWYKVAGPGDEGEPIYSYDARHGNNSISGLVMILFPVGTWNLGARWSDEHFGFGPRAYFQLSSSPAELRLEDVREAEAGLYRCRVDFKVREAVTQEDITRGEQSRTLSDQTVIFLHLRSADEIAAVFIQLD